MTNGMNDMEAALGLARKTVAEFEVGPVRKMAWDLIVHQQFLALHAQVEKMREALDWYEEKVRDCRKVHREGEVARAALDADGGSTARNALTDGKE